MPEEKEYERIVKLMHTQDTEEEKERVKREEKSKIQLRIVETSFKSIKKGDSYFAFAIAEFGPEDFRLYRF